jgi:hypothetical protein
MVIRLLEVQYTEDLKIGLPTYARPTHSQIGRQDILPQTFLYPVRSK